jgi:hypothetical protein
LPPPLLEGPLKLDGTFYAAKFQDHSDHPGTLSSPQRKSRVIKPESLPTVKRHHVAPGTSR